MSGGVLLYIFFCSTALFILLIYFLVSLLILPSGFSF